MITIPALVLLFLFIAIMLLGANLVTQGNATASWRHAELEIVAQTYGGEVL